LFTGSNSLRTHQDSSEQTRERGHQAIERAGSISTINLGPNLIEKAKRVFDIALTAKFTKGRRTNCVIAACCYITCRMEQTSHMMIDFADAFSTNIYQIGSLFLLLRRIFLADGSVMPLVDPSLYMARFAEKLEFGKDEKQVTCAALRLAQRMKRDWMNIGRRPAGICAACLYIAARMYGYSRTVREVVMIVKICQGTLRKRLKEFEETRSGRLRVSEFESVFIDFCEDPPAFRKRKAVGGDDDGIVDNSSGGIVDAPIEESSEQEEEDALLKEANLFISQSTQLTATSLLPLPLGNNNDEDGTLSDLDSDPEIITALDMDSDETEFKKQMWECENQDWIARQSARQTQGSTNKAVKPRKVCI
jgi:transcription factor IIIB 90 kDa subunit